MPRRRDDVPAPSAARDAIANALVQNGQYFDLGGYTHEDIDRTNAMINQSTSRFLSGITSMARPDRFRAAVATMPLSANIEDRRREYEKSLREIME